MSLSSLTSLGLAAVGLPSVALATAYLAYRDALRHRYEMARLRFARHVFDNSLTTDGLDGYARLEGKPSRPESSDPDQHDGGD
jgi:hypothetical protein